MHFLTIRQDTYFSSMTRAFSDFQRFVVPFLLVFSSVFMTNHDLFKTSQEVRTHSAYSRHVRRQACQKSYDYRARQAFVTLQGLYLYTFFVKQLVVLLKSGGE